MELSSGLNAENTYVQPPFKENSDHIIFQVFENKLSSKNNPELYHKIMTDISP